MDYRVFTETELIEEKLKIEEAIKELKRQIVTVRSQLYCLFIQHRINKAFEKMHQIDAELAYRKVNSKDED